MPYWTSANYGGETTYDLKPTMATFAKACKDVFRPLQRIRELFLYDI